LGEQKQNQPPAPAPAPKNTTLGADSFERSNYMTTYTNATVPEFIDELFSSSRKLIAWYAKKCGKSGLAADYFKTVQANLLEFTEELKGDRGAMGSKGIPFIGVRLWTTGLRFDGRIEFCGILNRALREDDLEAMEHVAVIGRALNMQCVSRCNKHTKWPMSNKTYRGAAMPVCHRDFFTVGKTYRAPMYLATSADEDVSSDFMDRDEPIMWTFHFDPVKKCKHVNYIDRNDGSVSDESEFLFVPYSIFRVRKVTWVHNAKFDPSAQIMRYHEIEVDVAPCNCKGPMVQPDLPLAPWA